MKSKPAQYTLPFLDTTSLGAGGFDLYSSFGAPLRAPSDSNDVTSAPETSATNEEASRIPAPDFRLDGDRKLAAGWKARAADNLAAIRLAQTIEDEDRHATAEEQEILSRFTAFGASDLANKLFRRAGESFAAGWDDLGNQLEQLVSREELASLSRATQYAHFTPEFVVRAIWKALYAHGHSPAGAFLNLAAGPASSSLSCPNRSPARLPLPA